MRLGGRTTKQLILDRVLLEAARLLRFSDLTIKEIAARLGFPDQFAFSKAFKRQRGEAPLDFPQPPLAELPLAAAGVSAAAAARLGLHGRSRPILLTTP